MEIPPEAWATISELLDQALDLAPQERQTWLGGLGPEHAALVPILQQFLEQASRLRETDFAATLRAGLPGGSMEDPEGAAALHPGDSVGPYRLVRLLGSGGMGAVWLAERSDGLINRSVALKLPHIFEERRALAQRFARERQILAGFTHPNIARLYDAGVSEQGRPYLALEYVEGKSITAWCDERQLEVRDRLALFLQVLEAVRHAHASLVIHRDLKPSNLMVNSSGQVQLLDFGIAKFLQSEESGPCDQTALTALGGLALTPQYAAPEQILGKPIGTAADIYALGVVLFELLTGTLPYRLKSHTRVELEQAIVTVDSVRPSAAVSALPGPSGVRRMAQGRLARLLRGDLDTIVLKALKKDPAQRYLSVESFAQDLNNYLEGRPVLARPDSPWYRTRKFLRRHWLPASAGVVTVISLALGLGLALWQAQRARAEARTAEAVQDFLQQIFEANSAQQADPQKAQQTTARELLDVGASKINDALGDAPQAKLRVYRTLGRMYSGLGMDPEAAELHRRRVEIARTTYGGDSDELVEALIDRADALSSKLNDPDWERVLKEANAILDRRGDADSPLRGRLLAQSAGFMQERDLSKAVADAEAALKILRRYPPDREFVRSLSVAAAGYAQRGEWEKCRPLLEEGIAIATGRSGKEMLDLLPELHNQLGGIEERLFDPVGANRDLRMAWELAKERNGAAHINTISFLVDYANDLFLNGHSAEAMARLEEALAALRSTKGADRSEVAVYVLSAYVNDAAYFGHYEDALAALTQVIEALGASADSPRMAHLMTEQASLFQHLGRYQAGLTLLDRARAIRNRVKTGAGFWDKSDEKIRFRLLLSMGRIADAAMTARHFLDEGAAASKLPLKAWLGQQFYRERLALAQGDPRSALALAQDSLARIRASSIRESLVASEQRSAIIAGKALVELHQAGAAEPVLRRSLELAGRMYDPQRSADLADNQIALGNCLLDLGRTQEARALAASAAAIHATHKELGEHYRKPLRMLELRLNAIGNPQQPDSPGKTIAGDPSRS